MNRRAVQLLVYHRKSVEVHPIIFGGGIIGLDSRLWGQKSAMLVKACVRERGSGYGHRLRRVMDINAPLRTLRSGLVLGSVLPDAGHEP